MKKNFWLMIVFMVLMGIGWWEGLRPGHGQSSPPPNIIILLTDDQRWDTLPYMPIVQSELMAQGVTFSNAFVTTPLCCPSRASILTGQYASRHGVHENEPPDGGFTAFQDSATLAVWLQAAGYRTALIGKYLNQYDSLYIPPGWDEWVAFRGELGYFDFGLNENGQAVFYGNGEYSTDVLTQKAVDFIAASNGTPFFLYWTPFAPHLPAVPAERHDGYHGNLAPWRPPSYYEADVSDKPAWVQALSTNPPSTLDFLRTQQLDTLLAVDEGVGAILQAVEAAGQSDNTVVIYLSDNGFSWGEHRWALKKRSVYEENLRIPMIIRYPGLAPAGTVEDRFVLNIDLAPTLIEIAGLDVPAGATDGLSLLPLLNGTTTTWREDFVVEFWQNVNVVPPYFALHTQEWKYVEYATGELELYDLSGDPYELANLAYHPDYQPLVTTLHNRLFALMATQSNYLPFVRSDE